MEQTGDDGQSAGETAISTEHYYSVEGGYWQGERYVLRVKIMLWVINWNQWEVGSMLIFLNWSVICN